MSSIGVRLVTPGEADLEAIADLVNRAFMVHRLMRGDRTDAAGLLEEAGPQGQFIVVEEDGVLVGTAMVRPVDESDVHGDYAPPPTALYYGLAGVEPSSMQQGIGQMLLREAERIALERGNTHLALNTLYEFDLVPYYARQGFLAKHDETFEAGHWGLPEQHRCCHMEKPL